MQRDTIFYWARGQALLFLSPHSVISLCACVTISIEAKQNKSNQIRELNRSRKSTF